MNLFGAATQKQGDATIEAAKTTRTGIRWQKIYPDSSFPSPRYYHSMANVQKYVHFLAQRTEVTSKDQSLLWEWDQFFFFI